MKVQAKVLASVISPEASAWLEGGCHLLHPHVVFLLSISASKFPLLIRTLGFPGGSVGKESAFNAGNHLQCRIPGFSLWVQSLGWEDRLEKEIATHSNILA